MKLLKLEEFLNLFKNEPGTLSDFLRKATVRTSAGLVPLKEYMTRREIDKSIIKTLFENIKNRNEYLTRFYNLSLRIDPDSLNIQTEPMKNKHMNNNESINYKILIRNMHYKGILQDTKSGIEGVPTYIDVLKDLYLHSIIDYKLLTPSASDYIAKGRIGSVFSSFYFRASIMNPYLVYSLNHSVLKGTKIFTPTLGWTSYCFGFLQCPYVSEYVGTDVIKDVCTKTQEYANMYKDKKTTIFCEPSENLAKSAQFRKKYREHFDVVFFSPPYYRLELYKGAEQSTNKYKSYEDWLKEYWENTIELCYHVLEKGGRLCYILSGYGSDNTKEQYDLLVDMNRITKKYFKVQSSQPMYNKDVHSTNHKETAEKIMVFIK
uniref:Type II methyltransferase M.TaqI-like domain-containing protein n=1 Tax=viral metagenome TaxID=1070528 RepID=A0A6C0B8M2_9ZZZZ